MTRFVARRNAVVMVLVGALAVALGGFAVRSAEAASPAPVEIVLGPVTSGIAAPAGTAEKSIPNVIAVEDGPLVVAVSFFDVSGEPASFNKDTRISVTAGDTAVRSVDTVARKGETTAYLDIAIDDPASQVELTVAFPGKDGDSYTATEDQLFDVLSELESETAETTGVFSPGIGGRNSCAEATKADPVCGIFVLPNAPAGQEVLLSRGPCDDSGYTGCTNGSVVQAIADLAGYSTTSPATFILKCDKTLCGTGRLQSKPVYWQTFADTAMRPAEPCPAKNTMTMDPCVDYVQSQRDGSGDTWFYILFADDARVSVG